MRRLYYFDQTIDAKSGELYAQVETAQEPLLITFNSGGGECQGSAAVVHGIRNARVHIHTYGIVQVCSAAFDMLMAGHTRGLHPDTILMTHASGTFSDATEKKLYQQAERGLYKHLPYILDNYGKFFSKKKRWWKAQELFELGLVHYLAPVPQLNADYGETEAVSSIAP